METQRPHKSNRPDLTAMLSSHLEAHYDIQVAELATLGTDVFRVDLVARQSWVARVFPIPHDKHCSSPLTAAHSLANTLSFLQQRGFPAEKCAHEKPVSQFDTYEVIVTEFLAGSPPQICDDTFRNLGDLLGRLHALSVGSGEGAIDWRGGAWHHLHSCGGVGDEIAAAEKLVSEARSTAPVDQCAAYEELRSKLLEKTNGLASANLLEALVHPDFVPSNVIHSPPGTLVAIDWTGSGLGIRIFSLAWLLWVAYRAGGIPMVENFAKGYRQHITLESAELVRLPTAIITRPLTLACWAVCNAGRDVHDLLQKLPLMQKLSEKIARCATATFTSAPPQAQLTGEGSSWSKVFSSNAPNPLQDIATTALFTTFIRAQETLRPSSNRLFSDPLAQLFISHFQYVVPPNQQESQRIDTLRKLIIARTLFFDSLLSSFYSGPANGTGDTQSSQQVVLLGAGYDTRAFRLSFLPSSTVVFELDSANVLEAKSLVLTSKLAGNVAAPVSLCTRVPVPVDLWSGGWPATLVAAGLQRNKPTAWIAEGVMMYLDKNTVNTVIDAVGALSCSGSRLGMDMASESESVEGCDDAQSEQGKKSQQSENSSSSLIGRLRRSTAPRDPVQWLKELGWNAEVTNTRDVLRAHGRISRATVEGKSNQIHRPKAIFIDATRVGASSK